MIKRVVATLAIALVPAFAEAAFIDFEELTSGVQGTGVLIYPEATFTSSTGEIYINGAGLTNDFCAYDGSCAGTLTVDFTTPVSNLTLRSAGEQQAGFFSNAAVFVNGVFAANVPIGYDGVFTTYDPIDLTAFVNVTRVVFTSTDGAGVTWDNFSFDTQTAVPEPATLSLLGLGLAGAARRLRRARRA